MSTEPKPRDSKFVNCIILSVYCTSFLFFFIKWMSIDTTFLIYIFISLSLFTLIVHYLILFKRISIYTFLCKIFGRKIRFFEFPFFVLNLSLFLSAFFFFPILLGLVDIPSGFNSIFNDDNWTMYVIFSGGTSLVASIISGLDIYPVNVFETQASLEHLIAITRDLMKLCNRAMVVIVGAILVGWTFKKIEFDKTIIYLTIYAILGFALGSTAVLGNRVTELLYKLATIEQKNLKEI